MRNRLVSRLCALIAVTSCLAGVAFGTIWTLENYVFSGWHFYPRAAHSLDLRGQRLSVKNYDDLHEKLPNCEITWSVPVHDSLFSNKAEEIQIKKLDWDDIPAIEHITGLKRIHAEECIDYAQLSYLRSQMPNVKVYYHVLIDGTVYNQDSTSVRLPRLDQQQIELLQYLPNLNHVDASGSPDFELVKALDQEHPEWNVSYAAHIAGVEFPSETEDITIRGAGYEELREAFGVLKNLKSITIQSPLATIDELHSLQAEFPKISIHWQVEFAGRMLDDDIEVVDISDTPLDSIESVEEQAVYLHNMKKLIVDSGKISNEDMAAFRERQRDHYKVVWTVYFTDKCKARTDETYFMPIKQGEYYFQEKHVYNLRYCEDMVCVDVGHAPIRNVDWLAFMPNLKYLILAHTEVQDVSPIVNCKKLIYLEVDWSTIRDYTPIAELTSLEDLNLNKTYCDITPILKMTWLKHLWAPGRGYQIGEQLREALPNTYLRLVDGNTDGISWRNLKNYYDMRDYLGMYYMD